MILSRELTRTQGLGDAGALPEEADERVGDDYLVEAVVGEFGLGRLYRALRSRRRLLVKVMWRRLAGDATAMARFTHETRLFANFEQPNIARAADFGMHDDGRLFLSFQHIEGELLSEHIARGPVPVDTAVRIIEQVCDALAVVHAARIVHRDVKPGSFWFTPDREVKLVDFSIARSLDNTTAPRHFVGTPLYASPEQALNLVMDARSDIYGVGVMAFELLAGRPPFIADDAATTVALRLHEAPRLPPLPAPLRALLQAMLEREPANRPGLSEIRQSLAHG